MKDLNLPPPSEPLGCPDIGKGQISRTDKGHNTRYARKVQNLTAHLETYRRIRHDYLNNNGYSAEDAYSSTNGFSDHYSYSADNRYGDGYSYSRNYGHGTGAEAYFPNNGYNNSYAHSTNKRSMKIAAQKTYLPLIDSSIVSMVPPPCFIKGTGKFAIPNISKKNAGVSQFGKTAVRRLNTKRTATVPCSKPAEEKFDIMFYVNNDQYYEKFVSKEEVTMISALERSRRLKSIMRNYFQYDSSSPSSCTSSEQAASVEVEEQRVSPSEKSAEEASVEVEEQSSSPRVKSAEEASVEVEEETDTGTEGLPESIDAEPVSVEPKTKAISDLMKNAKDAFELLPPNLCLFYRKDPIAKIKQYLDSQWKFNICCDCCQERPVHIAIKYRPELLSILSSKAEIDLPNKFGETALHLACEMGNTSMVIYLLHAGANPLKKNPKGETCLTMCQRKADVKMAKIILQTIKSNSIENFPEDHMMIAAGDGSTEFVKLYLKFKANVNYVDEAGNSAISLAVELGYEDLLVFLLKQKVNLKQTYKNEGNSLLHLACRHDREFSVEKLLFAGASVRAVNRFAETPLHMAAQYSSIYIVQKLLTFKSDIDAEDSCKRTPLHHAIVLEKVDVIKYLLNHGASIQAVITPLTKAIKNKQYNIIKLFIRYYLHMKQKKLRDLTLSGDVIEREYKDLEKLSEGPK
ncbi:hypothetical protein TSAR_009954 [Trichomalopsis sarcophagae]|uniref:Uncharacterized protein n=1 Tax=Trichomalopsis sarcophagae TaxID=543379 RepID=A0A232ENJ1_9HYME|nr:hypothetical protein TSAR_009954 [Trichomalopsis sarcophagae]